MRKSDSAKHHNGVIARNITVRDGKTFSCRVVAYLQKRYPVWTAKHVARDTGVPSPTIAKWINAGCAPSMAHVSALAIAYKLDFLAAVFIEVTELEFHAAEDRLAAAQAQSAALAVIVREMQS